MYVHPNYHITDCDQCIQLPCSCAVEKDIGQKKWCRISDGVDDHFCRYWENLAKRKCITVGAAVGRKDNEEVEFKYDNGVFGGIVDKAFDNKKGKHEKQKLQKKKTVQLRSLFEKFDVPKIIDYWSFDVEGAEDYIASAFPWGQYFPQLITVERPSSALQQLLYDKGMRFMCDISSFGEQLWCAADKWHKHDAKFKEAHINGVDPWNKRPILDLRLDKASKRDYSAQWGLAKKLHKRCMDRGIDYIPSKCRNSKIVKGIKYPELKLQDKCPEPGANVYI